jgi:hypothetical protein
MGFRQSLLNDVKHRVAGFRRRRNDFAEQSQYATSCRNDNTLRNHQRSEILHHKQITFARVLEG